ncbi:relaxase/mobilization nuclease domain-containing protein, partial [Maritalea sp.]|uniref:relaxase/mobilization nuclease domain-containing protein n=1 Tax=Maritalea sp. TaxID=2003361 RepID=UPI0039E33DC3
MILKGSERGGAIQMARHLENTHDNEIVTVHQIRGFVSDTVAGALSEAYAISQGTKCRNFIFSLSLSPPETEKVPVGIFEKAISDIENKLGLAGQPCVIVFHEKEGRRHAHCVWSRIDGDAMKAINISHYKLKLRDISRELYLEHNWQMPRGLMNSEERDHLNYSYEEYQQAKRIKANPKIIKQAFQDCWAVSDGCHTFAHALEERGYYLAKGDRRSFVAVDWRGEVYAISKWVGIRTKDIKTKLGDPDKLQTIDRTKQQLATNFTAKLREYADQEISRYQNGATALVERRQNLSETHRQKRNELEAQQEKRRVAETKQRTSQLPKGLKALWFRITGKYARIKTQIEKEARASETRTIAEIQSLIEKQLSERRLLQHKVRQERHRHTITLKKLNREIKRQLGGDDFEQKRKISITKNVQ